MQEISEVLVSEAPLCTQPSMVSLHCSSLYHSIGVLTKNICHCIDIKDTSDTVTHFLLFITSLTVLAKGQFQPCLSLHACMHACMYLLAIRNLVYYFRRKNIFICSNNIIVSWEVFLHEIFCQMINYGMT